MFSVKYMGIYGVKLMAQHTAQQLETLTVVKSTEILITQQIQKFMLIQKQSFVGLLYAMLRQKTGSMGVVA